MTVLDNNNNNNNNPPSINIVRRRRPPLFNRRLLLNPINFDDFDLSSEDENESRTSQLVLRLRNRSEVSEDLEELERVMRQNKKEKKELKIFKKNYKKMIDNIPNKIIKELISENKCSICLEDNIQFDQTYIITSCFHIFHNNCLQESQNFNKKCPLCRNNLTNSYYKKINFNIIDKGSDIFT